MLITCLRHATAEPTIPHTVDRERALIKKGREQTKRVAEFCRKNAIKPSVLYSSPLRRAEQTANSLHSGLPDCPPPTKAEWLSPDRPTALIISELKRLQANDVDDAWLVGHEPNLSLLISELLNIDVDCLQIKKASLTRLQIDFTSEAPARLLWSIPCALMR